MSDYNDRRAYWDAYFADQRAHTQAQPSAQPCLPNAGAQLDRLCTVERLMGIDFPSEGKRNPLYPEWPAPEPGSMRTYQ